MKPTEPSSTVSCPRHLQFQIGHDSHGNWVVQDKRGICGGLFINRVEALRFAMFENGNRPEAVVMVPGVFELDINRKGPARHAPANGNSPTQRKTA